MSYDLIYNGISGLVKQLGFKESTFPSMENVPSEQIGSVFVLNPRSGQNDENTSETLSSLIYDIQIWEIEIAFQKSIHQQGASQDKASRTAYDLIQLLDNPANWSSYVRIQKYLSWKIEDKKSYFLLTMQLKIVDTITY